jgi:DNA-binding transcriptional LysR family regulator
MQRLLASQEGQRNRLQKLRNFCYAVRTGSISKAAELASLSQPSVSLQVQALEKEFDTVLFRRKGPRIILTPEGEALYQLAWPLVEGIDALPTTFRASRQGLETGRLSVAAGESTILYILPRFLQEYHRAHPGIALKVHNVTGHDGLNLLRSDAVDLAVGSLLEVPDDITYQPTFSYDPMLITAPDHPLARKGPAVTLKDVAQYPLILPPAHLTTWRVVDYAFHKHRLNYRVALEVGGWEVIKRYVALGMGVSIVTSICLTGSEPLVAIPFNRYFPKRTYGIVVCKGKMLPPPAARFVELLRGGKGEHQDSAPRDDNRSAAG